MLVRYYLKKGDVDARLAVAILDHCLDGSVAEGDSGE